MLRVDGHGNASIVAPGPPQGEIKVAGAAPSDGGSKSQPAGSDTDKAIASTEKQISDLDKKEKKQPSLAKRVGGALQQAGEGIAKGGGKPQGEAASGGDAGLAALGQQVAAQGQSAQQRGAQSVGQEYERASHLLDAPQIQSAEQLASLKPGQAFRSPDGKLRYYMPGAGNG